MVIKGSDRSHDFKTRERKAPEVRSAPRAAARKAIRDKLEKQARDTAHNDYVNQPREQNAPEAYGTEQVEALAQKAGDTTYATMKTASPKREAALRFKRREQTRKTAEQVQLRSSVLQEKIAEIAKAIGHAVTSGTKSMSWMLAIPIIVGALFLGAAGALFGSPIGIVTGGGADGTPTVTELLQQMDRELSDRISSIMGAAGEVDEVSLSYNGTGSYAYIQNMADIVAVFAVKAGLNDTEPLDVLTMDAKRIRLFREVFWDMVSVSSELTETEVDSGLTDENDVPILETHRRLDIRIDTKSWRELYPSLNADQQEIMEILMTEPLLSMVQAMCGSDSMLTLTEKQIEEMESYLPEDLDPIRRKIVETAWSLVGKVGYFWGGKSEVIGWDTRWGVPTVVTSIGNETYGTVQPFGLDCSGFVTWVMINAAGDAQAANQIGHGTSSQWSNTTEISWSDAQPGDLVWVSPGWALDNHIGIIVGRNTSGQLMVCHCSAGGVVVTTAGQFHYVRRMAGLRTANSVYSIKRTVPKHPRFWAMILFYRLIY